MSSASSPMWLGRYSSVLMILLCPAIYWALRSPYVLIQYVISEALICARETKCLSIRLSAVVSCINARVACFSLLSCRTGKTMCRFGSCPSAGDVSRSCNVSAYLFAWRATAGFCPCLLWWSVPLRWLCTGLYLRFVDVTLPLWSSPDV